MGIINKIFGDPNQKVIKSLQPTIDKINSMEDGLQKKTDDELKQLSDSLKNRAKNIENLDDLLPEAFALVREASKRVLRLRHYDVQIIGGIVLHRGQIAEMKTGEGKTLVATLPLFLNALTGKGANLVTVNDYLARIGAGWKAPLYSFLGLSVGVITHETGYIYDPEYTDESQFDERLMHLKPVSRKEAYEADITYGTNNEFGFDYLRDNMVPGMDRMVQRGLHYAIVDEVDSILIDEARTPLIISAPAEESTDRYYKFAELVARLRENNDYNVDEKMRAATLTEAGINKMEKWLGVQNIYTAGGIKEVHHIEQALKARVLFSRDKDYVVREGEVIIVDEFTGRMMQGRRYSEGLHQAIEAKEGVKIQRESQTLATITFQNFFRMYEKLSGMTGTAATEAEEFSKIYNLETVIIPTHRPSQRKDFNDLIYRSEAGKYKAVVEEVKECQKNGQPVLVGTISVEKNEMLAEMFERNGIKAEVLNAKNHLKEAKIIAQAGRAGAVTLATNMAGRGVDIILGGQPFDEEEYRKVVDLGGLHVIGTERHESRRIDNQLRGRAGRQGDPGSSQFYVSTEDDLMRIFGGDRMKRIMTTLKVPEDMPIENKLISRSIESAQKKVEGHNFDIRKHLVEYDDVINKHREAIYKRRREVLEKSGEKDEDSGALTPIISEMVKSEISQVVHFHTASENIADWNVEEIYETAKSVFSAKEELKERLLKIKEESKKFDKAKKRKEIIGVLEKIAEKEYNEMKEKIRGLGIRWKEIEKEILIRSIDTMWVEHLETMDYMRRGIGLRGYGQQDPLVEYKKESYRLYNELNGLIQKQVVYSIYKIGMAEQEAKERFSAPTLEDRAKNFSAPSKTMNSGNSSFSGFKSEGKKNSSMDSTERTENVSQKIKTADGEKVGRNDPCPCGSGKKFKKCCGK